MNVKEPRMVSSDTKVTAAFVVAALVLWLLAQRFTDSSWVLLAILLGIGVVLPTALNEMRG
jgi:fatty acid desaturase